MIYGREPEESQKKSSGGTIRQRKTYQKEGAKTVGLEKAGGGFLRKSSGNNEGRKKS